MARRTIRRVLREGVEVDSGPWPTTDRAPAEEFPLQYDLGAMIAARFPEYRAFVLDFLRAADQSSDYEEFARAMQACILPEVRNPSLDDLMNIWAIVRMYK